MRALTEVSKDVVVTGDINSDTCWKQALTGVNVVVHLAAQTKVNPACGDNPLDAFRRVNCAGTLNLARQAAEEGVKRFIFLSSAKVHGEQTHAGNPFREDDVPDPQDPYAISKLEAEEGLREIAHKTGLDVVIIRPPLVYGPGVKGNFANLIKWVDRCLPLPLGGVDNKRSLIGVGNLVDFVITCIEHPAAASRTFLVSDGEDLSTSALLRRVAQAQNKRARLFSLPPHLLALGAKLLGKQHAAQRLLGSLQVDVRKARTVLEWEPPFSMQEELDRCVSAALSSPGIKISPLLRVFDLILSVAGLIVCSPFFVLILLVGWFDNGSPLFKQQRVGKDKRPFVLVKFRTMKRDTASVPSHMADSACITQLGKLLRRTKLDELPQLWNVLKGEMSMVGPRPGLFNQQELTLAREKHGVLEVRPGITGLSQISGIDMSTPELLAETDREMLEKLSVADYFFYIFKTVSGKGLGDRIR
ncbi:MAG: sugar transferase [Desulfuromonadaceae bacterium]